VEVLHVAHLDLLDTLQCLPVEEKRRVDALSLVVVTASWRVDWAWDCASLRERSDILREFGPGPHSRHSRRSGGCSGGSQRVVAATSDWGITAAALHEGCRRPSAWSDGSNARNDLARAEDLGERDLLERDVHICGRALEKRDTPRDLVFMLHVVVQELRSTAKDDLVAVVIVEEQLEVI
jgi:hypothetical protein